MRNLNYNAKQKANFLKFKVDRCDGIFQTEYPSFNLSLNETLQIFCSGIFYLKDI